MLADGQIIYFPGTTTLPMVNYRSELIAQLAIPNFGPNARPDLYAWLNDPFNGGEVKLPLPKCLVASRLAMQPETFSRILAELKTNNLIRVDRSKLYIPDLARLIQVEQ